MSIQRGYEPNSGKGRVIDRLLSFPWGQGCMHCCIKWLAAVRLRSIWNPLTRCDYLPTFWNTKWRSHIYKCSHHAASILSSCITIFVVHQRVCGIKTHAKICSDVSDEQSKLTPTVVARSNRFHHGRWTHCISLHDFQYVSVAEVSPAAQVLGFFGGLMCISNHCFTSDGCQQEQPQKVSLRI